MLLLNGNQPLTGTFEATVSLNTNDPDTPTLTFPIKLVQGGLAPAPHIAAIVLDPDYRDFRPWRPGENVRFTLWDNDSRTTMEASLTITGPSPSAAELVKDLPMEAASRPGEYTAYWTIPAGAADGAYSLTFTLHDPATELDGTDNSRVLNIRKVNTVPVDGEAEGLPTIVRRILDNFPTADNDHSGGLSLAEAQAQVPRLDPDAFTQLDANADAQLAAAELEQYLHPGEGEGEVPGEGEGEGGNEGEGEHPVEGEAEWLRVVADSLLAVFSLADADHSGGLSFAEAKALTASLDTDTFNALDANHDGQLTQAELNQYLGHNEGEGGSEGEGEGGGEGEPPSNIAQALIDHFTSADTDHSGGLSLAEAAAALPGLTSAQFLQFDANGDGQLTLDELNQAINPGGCTCNKSSAADKRLKGRLADMFLIALALSSLMVVAGRKI